MYIKPQDENPGPEMIVLYEMPNGLPPVMGQAIHVKRIDSYARKSVIELKQKKYVQETQYKCST